FRGGGRVCGGGRGLLGTGPSGVGKESTGAADGDPWKTAFPWFGVAPGPPLAAGRVLRGPKADPSRQTAPRAERPPVADLSNQGSGDDRANAGDLLEPPALFT